MMKSSPDLARRDAAVAVAIEVLELTEDLLWNAFKFEKLPDEHLIMGGGRSGWRSGWHSEGHSGRQSGWQSGRQSAHQAPSKCPQGQSEAIRGAIRQLSGNQAIKVQSHLAQLAKGVIRGQAPMCDQGAA